VIDASQTFAPINPNLYGMFIEHAGGLVYRGMWAEMIDDRKFYNPIKPEDRTQPLSREDVAEVACLAAHLGSGRRWARRNPSPWTPSMLTSVTSPRDSAERPASLAAFARPASRCCKARTTQAGLCSLAILPPRCLSASFGEPALLTARR